MIKQYVARYFGQPVERVRVQKLAGGASTRQYFRVSLPDGPSHVVAHYPEAVDAATHPMCQVTRLFLNAGLPVAEILDVEESAGLMLHNDLGDTGIQDWLPSASMEERRIVYRQAVDLILSIQDATQLAVDLNCIAAQLAFDEEKLNWELEFFYRYFFEDYLGQSLDPGLTSRIFDEFGRIARGLACRPRVLCHRDFHSRNLLLHHGRLFIVDHQDARMGPISYDLASLLGDPYVTLDETFCREMVHYFLARRNERTALIPDGDWQAGFDDEYQLMLVQRLLKAVGSYAYQIAVIGNDIYRQYIPQAIGRALRAMNTLDDFASIRSVLAPLMRDDQLAGRTLPG